MPAERTRSNRRTDDEPQALTWKSEHTPSTISFATNLTPSTFNDPMPPLVDRPESTFTVSESTLFPPMDFIDSSDTDKDETSTRVPHCRKKPPSDVPHIPRPPNAFILFRASFIKQRHVSAAVETSHSTLSTIIGMTWQGLPDDEREAWHGKARAAREAHKRKWPEYAFKPAKDTGSNGGNRSKGGTAKKGASDNKDKSNGGAKRKVREVGPTDHKRCNRIAQLLVEGKKGADLDKAISEFDKTHVPEVVTRFEEVVTAGMYEAGNTTGRKSSGKKEGAGTGGKSRPRRSSSVPIIAAEAPFLQQPSTPTRARRLRASSSQPSRVSTPDSDMGFGSFSFPVKAATPSTPSNPAFDFSTFTNESSSPLTVFDGTASADNGLYDPMMFPQTPCSPRFEYNSYSSAESTQPSSPLRIDTSFDYPSSPSLDYQQCSPCYSSTPSTPYYPPSSPSYYEPVSEMTNYSNYYEQVSSPQLESAVSLTHQPTSPDFYPPSSPSYTDVSPPSFTQTPSFISLQDSLQEDDNPFAPPISSVLDIRMNDRDNIQLPNDILFEANAPIPAGHADHLNSNPLAMFQNGLATHPAYNMAFQFIQRCDNTNFNPIDFDTGCGAQLNKLPPCGTLDFTFLNEYGLSN